MRRSPLKKTRTSVPQIPHALTRNRTPSAGHVASGTSPTLIFPGPSQIAARIESSLSTCLQSACEGCNVHQVVRQLGLAGEKLTEFIFMLTRDDRTIADAREVYESIADTGIRHVGCKDVGLPPDELGALLDEIDAIAEDARRAEELGVDGINLLAYRYDRDVDALVEAVVAATSLPVIAAGSVDSQERIKALADRGVWGFTIGTAALDGKLVPGAPLEEQLTYILRAANGV